MATRYHTDTKKEKFRTCRGCDREFPSRLIGTYLVTAVKKPDGGHYRLELCPLCASPAPPTNPLGRIDYEEAIGLYPDAE